MKIIHACGQTCNKFWIYTNYLADSIESGEKLIILAPDITTKDYSNLLNSEYIKFPFYYNSLTKIVGYSTYIKFLNIVFANKLIVRVLQVFFNMIPSIHFINAPVGGYLNNKKGIHKKKINELFSPNQAIKEQVLTAFQPFKKKDNIICGVHIRRGDYKSFNGGKYYYSNLQYHLLMLNFKKIFPEKLVSFFVCSNEVIDLSFFSNCECFSLQKVSSTKDLFGLSICDYIIGPKSTFSGWASYINNIPIYFIEDPTEFINETSFYQIMDIWH